MQELKEADLGNFSAGEGEPKISGESFTTMESLGAGRNKRRYC